MGCYLNEDTRPARVKGRSWGLAAIRKITGDEGLDHQAGVHYQPPYSQDKLSPMPGPSFTFLHSILRHLAGVGIFLPFYRRAK